MVTSAMSGRDMYAAVASYRKAQPAGLQEQARSFVTQASQNKIESTPDAKDGALTQMLIQNKTEAKMTLDKLTSECQTCKDRRYQDGSDDSSVSYKTPANIAPGVSASVVLGHEKEHVANEQAQAEKSGGQVVSQSVVLHGSVCPDCGRHYVAGGTTQTTVRTRSLPARRLDAWA